MPVRPLPLLVSLAGLAAVSLPTADARACGGYFPPVNETQSTAVTGHRMAFAVSTTHAVLWDQIQYAGSPKDFAWVLPVHAGAVVQLSNDAWFEALDAGTTAQIASPSVNCVSPDPSPPSPGCAMGCGSEEIGGGTTGSSGAGGPFGVSPPPPPPVTVTHEGTVGPYQTVTLHANVPNALPSWLTANGYAIDPTVSPIIDAYTAEGFDFIALRLSPNEGVQQMKPVRVVTPGMSATLPLRMVAAGTGATVAITLFVIGEGRWEAQNFPNGTVDPSTLTWSFATQSSDYAAARLALMAEGGGRTWNTAFAELGALLSPPATGAPSLVVNGQMVETLAGAYLAQGVADGVTGVDATACATQADGLAGSGAQLVDCGAGDSGTGGASGTGGGSGNGGGTGGGSGGVPACASLPAGQTPVSQLACGPLDDLAVAFDGLHPSSVWLTRLEANLPRAALSDDLQLQAAPQQTAQSNAIDVTRSTGDPCPPGTTAGGMSSGPASRAIRLRNRLALLATVLGAALATVARRKRRVLVLAGRPLRAS